jgi:hypothetical protein
MSRFLLFLQTSQRADFVFAAAEQAATNDALLKGVLVIKFLLSSTLTAHIIHSISHQNPSSPLLP